MRLAVYGANVLLLLLLLGLCLKSLPLLIEHPLVGLLLSSTWRPLSGHFGLRPFVVGTLEVTLLAMLLAVPACLLAAIYLAEYAGRRLRDALMVMIELMAGIPSVIYGLFGVLVIVPLIARLGAALGRPTTGYSLLAGGVILAIMVAPIITAVSVEVLRAVPFAGREAALALGLTRWEVARRVVVPSAAHGLVSAVALGFARAIGETIAVLMVVGNVARIPLSLFDPAYPLPALIANNYGEMMSLPLYDSALMFAALILLLVVGAFNLAAHLVLSRLEIRS